MNQDSIKNLDIEMLLVQKYQDIFQENQEIINSFLSDPNLSKIHLGFVPKDFYEKSHRILIVGRETRAWNFSERKIENEQKVVLNLQPVRQYDRNSVQYLMEWSKYWVQKNLDNPKPIRKKGKSFFNFFRTIAKENANATILWGNIFCVSYKKGEPNNIKNKSIFRNIKKVSELLLKAQLEVLKPNIVIFASGLSKSSILARREYFKDLKPSGKNVIEGLNKKYLEQFYFPDDKILCYRTVHPSSRVKNSAQPLKELRKILKEYTSS